jgi:L-fucose isomerase-like protein
VETSKSTFAVLFGNRGFFPASLIGCARTELCDALERLGHGVLMMDAGATRHGAVELVEEGRKFARFVDENRDKIDGVILSLPNFGDENGAGAALRDARMPILIQAYPDSLEAMNPAERRDAFCGKLSIMDVLCQNGVAFTALKPHVVHPAQPEFAENIDHFARLCRVVRGMRSLTVGALGARTTAFKTVRIDELALQEHGITVETIDLSDLFARAKGLKEDDAKLQAKMSGLQDYTSWEGVPPSALGNLARVAVAIDDIVDEMALDAVSVRCWPEIQQQFGVSPCVLLSEMNDRGLTAACELDTGSAVAMYALGRASGDAAACLDWNNNYGDDENKCILFHCGPVPQRMMTGKGRVVDHAILMAAMGPGCSYGCNVGRIAPMPFTFGGLLTKAGRVKVYLGQGDVTADPIPADFFGCAGVAAIPHLQDVLLTIGTGGHRHHVTVTPGKCAAPLREAFEKYLGFDVTVVG